MTDLTGNPSLTPTWQLTTVYNVTSISGEPHSLLTSEASACAHTHTQYKYTYRQNIHITIRQKKRGKDENKS